MGMDADAYLFFGISAREGAHSGGPTSKDVGNTIGLEVEDDGDLWGYGHRLSKECMEPMGMELDYHRGSMDPVWHIRSKDTLMRAWLGHHESFDGLPAVPEGHRQLLARWAELLGWDPPRWVLASHFSE
jgi:hypothetical protein